MINLHELMPEHFAEDHVIDIDLDTRYKVYSSTSHEFALGMIFVEGMMHANEIRKKAPDEVLEDDATVQRKAIAQTMGMGEIFKK